MIGSRDMIGGEKCGVGSAERLIALERPVWPFRTSATLSLQQKEMTDMPSPYAALSQDPR